MSSVDVRCKEIQLIQFHDHFGQCFSFIDIELFGMFVDALPSVITDRFSSHVFLFADRHISIRSSQTVKHLVPTIIFLNPQVKNVLVM